MVLTKNTYENLFNRWDKYCHFTPGSISLLNSEIYQRGRVSRVVDTELILLIAHLI